MGTYRFLAESVVLRIMGVLVGGAEVTKGCAPGVVGLCLVQ